MFGSVDKGKGYLFCTYDLAQGMRSAIEAMRKEVDTLDANRLLNTAPEDLKAYFAQKYGITALRLLRENWYATPSETKVDVRYDPMRWIDDKSQPAWVSGERIEVRVPFEGEAQLFYNSASTMTTSPPRAVVDGNELVLVYETPSDAPRDIMPLAERALADIEQYLGWQRSMIDAHNQQLLSEAAAAIQGRRERLLAQSKRVAALGIPIKQRDGAPTTYAVATARRKAAPVLPPASSAPYVAEPTWAPEHYEHALTVMQSMALVMERSPSAFKPMDEEAIRQAFLMQLNGQFEGKATAETFNMSGKTDILLREGDRNVFIAECKFWKGPKAFSEAIDQLLGYATWRDSKTAILVFNRATETSTVLAGVDATAKAHANFKRVVSWPHESGFRYVFHANGDPNRELILTVLVFHVPQ